MLRSRSPARLAAPLLAGLLVLGTFFLTARPVAEAQGPPPAAQARIDLLLAMAVQDMHTEQLLTNPGVVGTATGLDRQGRPVIRIYVIDQNDRRGLPQALNGIPVDVQVTGEILAVRDLPRPQHHNPGHGGGKGGGNGGGNNGGNGGGDEEPPPEPGEELLGDPRNVWIGLSSGNINECAAGTVGCRLIDGNDRHFALSNNHVYARNNSAQLGEEIVVPSRLESFCNAEEENIVGLLWDYEPIRFGRGKNSGNLVDAAVAWTTEAHLDNVTPEVGFGGTGESGYAPYSPSFEILTIDEDIIGRGVQKFGRTTNWTTGTVSDINVSVTVRYGTQQAVFHDQISIVGGTNMIGAGDSGSLFVTDDAGAQPVGLLFAGTSNGSLAIANRIDHVLNRFAMDVDGP